MRGLSESRWIIPVSLGLVACMPLAVFWALWTPSSDADCTPAVQLLLLENLRVAHSPVLALIAAGFAGVLMAELWVQSFFRSSRIPRRIGSLARWMVPILAGGAMMLGIDLWGRRRLDVCILEALRADSPLSREVPTTTSFIGGRVADGLTMPMFIDQATAMLAGMVVGWVIYRAVAARSR